MFYVRRYPQAPRAEYGIFEEGSNVLYGTAYTPETAQRFAASSDLLAALVRLVEKAESVLGDHKGVILDAKEAIVKARPKQ